MIVSLARKLFGSHNDRVLQAQTQVVASINALEPQIKALSDDALRAKTVEFRERLAKGATLDALLPEAFAVVREAAWRVLGQRPFDVQLRGGMVLHQGKIAEISRILRRRTKQINFKNLTSNSFVTYRYI